MAKNKEKIEVNTDYAAQIQAELEKDYGEGIFTNARYVLETPKKVFGFSPALDEATGGIPEGCLVLCSGKPKHGKTSSILHFAKKFLEADSKHQVYYFDVEARLKQMNIQGTPGLDLDRFHIISSTQGNILYAEKILSMVEKIANRNPNCLIIVDSLSALCPETEYVGDMSGQIRPVGPKLLSLFFKRMSNVLAVNKVILICMQHLITNTSGYGPKYMEDGGVKAQYHMDIKMRIKYAERWTVGSADNEQCIGLKVNWEIPCSALGMAPDQECTSYIRFGTGIDELKEYMDMAVGLGIINKAGAWFAFGEDKVQGEEKLYRFFVENPNKKDEMIQRIKEMTT